MKFTKSLGAILATTIITTSCSILERHEESVADAPSPTPTVTRPRIANELSKMETKIAALETKVEVLTANLERIQLQKSQPMIEANIPSDAPQNSLSAPVSEAPLPSRISAAPASLNDMETAENPSSKMTAEPVAKILSTPSQFSATPRGIESEFKSAMETFQMGSFSDASARFRKIANQNGHHTLASHALFWSGESNARSEQWSAAADDWTKLEQMYSRSAYIPDALAGLSKAYAKLGETAKASKYKDLLINSFPNAPASMGLLKFESGNAMNSSKVTSFNRSEKTDKPIDRPFPDAHKVSLTSNSEPEIPAYEPGDENSSGSSE